MEHNVTRGALEPNWGFWGHLGLQTPDGLGKGWDSCRTVSAHFVTHPFTLFLRHPPIQIITYLKLVTGGSPLGFTQNMNNVHLKTKVSGSTHAPQ